MASFEDHRWPVCVKNATTGTARTWRRMPRAFHAGWAVSMCLYTFIGWLPRMPAAGFIAWEVFFAVLWAASWAYIAQETVRS